MESIFGILLQSINYIRCLLYFIIYDKVINNRLLSLMINVMGGGLQIFGLLLPLFGLRNLRVQQDQHLLHCLKITIEWWALMLLILLSTFFTLFLSIL